jgi:hypothetical protein
MKPSISYDIWDNRIDMYMPEGAKPEDTVEISVELLTIIVDRLNDIGRTLR